MSGKKQRMLLDQLQEECKTVIRDRFVPALFEDFRTILGDSKNGATTVWSISIDPGDKQAVLFHYPQAVALQGIVMPAYTSPYVRLELGARSDSWPAGEHTVTPYAAELFPDMFTAASCKVKALEAVRTFWEKATILHMEYHRPKGESPRERLARHYYDLYRLSQSPICENALAQLDLLHRVVEHKMIFFRSAWAHYETATPGSFHLVPPLERMATLRADYAQMKAMIFGDYPEWDEIVQGLTELEKRINCQQ